MSLTADLIDQFVQATNDEKQEVSDGIAYGTVVKDGDATYVRLDGSTYDTPVTTTTNVKHDERVVVLIKNHTATITGNFSSPADSTSSLMTSIDSFDMAVGKKLSLEELTANSAFIKFLLSDEIVAEDIIAANAKIDEIEADKLTVEDLKAVYGNFEALDAYFAKLGVAEIDKATIKDLNATSGHFRDLHVDYGEFERITVTKGTFDDIVTDTIEAQIINGTALDVKYANVEFGNIGEAAVEKIFSESGIINDLIVSEGKITGELVGVTIKGDLIEANTLRADKLVVLGSDGKYYKLNTDFTAVPGVEPVEDDKIHGSSLVANSITAEKIRVDDLVAFGATIGGFKMTANSLYSDVKSAVNNDTRGIYMDTDGQFAVGDANGFLKFYKAPDGTYKLAIRGELILSGSGKSVEEEVGKAVIGVDIKYALSDSPTVAPTDGWSGSITAEKVDAKYVWQRTTTTYANGKTNVSVVCIQGATGKDGTGVESITTEYCVTSSKDASPNGYKNGEYGLAVIQNDDGTQTLAITDAAGSYDISLLQGANGSKILSIANAEDGGSYDISLIEGETGAKILSVENAAGESQDYNISLLQGDNGAKILSIVTAAGGFDIVVTDNNDGTQTLEISDAEGWSEEPPVWSPGKYVWTRHKIVYKNPTSIVYTTPVCDSSWEAVNELEGDMNESIANVKNDTESDLNEASEKILAHLNKSLSEDAARITALNGRIEFIEDRLHRIVTDENGTTLFEQTGDGYAFSFYDTEGKLLDLDENMADALEYRGHIHFKDGDGDPYILIQASKNADDCDIRLKLDNSKMCFLNRFEEEIGAITADTEGRLGIAVDNETVTGELRQSNQNEEHGEFVWQVRPNGNYGLSWKG